MIVNQINQNITFSRAFTTDERKEAENVKKVALELLGNKKRILIIPELSMPKNNDNFIGYGQLNNKKTFELLDFLKTYSGLTTLKVLPQGDYSYSSNGYYPAYRSSSLTLGKQLINLEELTTDKMNNILSIETFQKVLTENSNKTEKMVDFEYLTKSNSLIDIALRESYKNFLNKPDDNLYKEFILYKAENYKIIEKKALFEILSKKYNTRNANKWGNEVDTNLFNPDIVNNTTRNSRINEIKKKHSFEFDFEFFKQFLAEKNLSEAKKQINAKGINLMGDCLVAFSNDEIWGYPKAFEKYANIASADWGIKALNYPDLLKDGSEAQTLLKNKVSQFAKRYDEIRFDIGWGYVEPILYTDDKYSHLITDRYYYDGNGRYKLKNKPNGKIIDLIENIVRDIKGNKFNKSCLIYEIESGPEEYSPYKWEQNRAISIKNEFKGRKIVQSNIYMDDNYATLKFFDDILGSTSDIIYMSGNHDHLALNSLAQKKDTDGILKRFGNDITTVYNKQIKELSKKFNKDLNLLKNNADEFIKLKWSYLLFAENIKMFFMDVFGRNEQFDSQINSNPNNYRYMISSNFEDEFHQAVQNNKALNLWDAIAKNMEARGLNKGEHSLLYDKVIKFANILYEKGVKTEFEANRIFAKKSTHISKTGKIIIALIGVTIGGALSLIHIKKNHERHEHTD